MLSYYFDFAVALFDEVFNNSMFELFTLSFLFMIGLALLNMLRKIA